MELPSSITDQIVVKQPSTVTPGETFFIKNMQIAWNAHEIQAPMLKTLAAELP